MGLHVSNEIFMARSPLNSPCLQTGLHVSNKIYMMRFTCLQMDLHVSTEISMCLIKISISTRISLHNTLTLCSQSQSILHFLNNNVIYYKSNMQTHRTLISLEDTLTNSTRRYINKNHEKVK